MRTAFALCLTVALIACDEPLRPSPSTDRTPSLATVATEPDALAISANIQRLHLPYGTMIDPVFASADPASPDFVRLVSYTRAGDAAIWTGHYLAAEAFRYGVTRSREALRNVRTTIAGITGLVDVTGTDLLARFYMPTTSPYVADITAGEQKHTRREGTIDGQPYFWWGNTSRDQYSGVFFGLGVAYDLVDDAQAQRHVKRVITRMLDFLLRNGWNVVMPDGQISTTFIGRADQQLSFLQVGRRVNPERFAAIYDAHRAALAAEVPLPITGECFDPHNSYFKFNLDHINLYNLIRLEEPLSPALPLYMQAFTTLRGCTGEHQNAHFNMIDRGIRGPDAARDAETDALLDLWLERPRRDYFVDVRSEYPECEDNRSCTPVRVDQRVNTDFLWQRSPFQTYGGGQGLIETAAIDYILPYWMSRWYAR
ncbi:MAG TPA: hypothetical protein VJ650_08480 [Gemmatimonadaceae bacterium]|nr:hypothetical protein [Gemmatimonadaceae bacterium]